MLRTVYVALACLPLLAGLGCGRLAPAFAPAEVPEPDWKEPDRRWTTNTLMELWAGNSLAAEKRLKGKRIAVAGPVESVEENGRGANVYLSRVVAPFRRDVRCEFASQDDALKLSVEDVIGVAGDCAGPDGRTIVLKRCKVLTFDKNSPAGKGR